MISSALFGGLYLGEVVLMVLGIVLFVVLVAVLIYQVLHQRKFTGLLGFFLIPVVMIGYPTIKSIQYKDGVVSIEKMEDQVASNPTDAAARQALDAKVQEVDARPSANPKDAVTLARAQYTLGRDKQAVATLQAATRVDPQAAGAAALKAKMDTVQRLEELSTKVEQDPKDAQARADLQSNIKRAGQTTWANPNALASIARAQTAVGEHKTALDTINKAVAIAPNAKSYLVLRQAIASKVSP